MQVGRELVVTLVLKDLLERSFPDEYEARRAEESDAAAPAPAADAPLPLFVMSLLLPGANKREGPRLACCCGAP